MINACMNCSFGFRWFGSENAGMRKSFDSSDKVLQNVIKLLLNTEEMVS